MNSNTTNQGRFTMKTKFLALLGALIIVALSAGVSIASADPGGQGQNCEQGAQNQNFCGDTITVVPATDEQCPNGGVVIKVNGEPVGVVCNGAAGPSGAAGQDGSDGQAGADGEAGAAGAPGATGAAGPKGQKGETTLSVVEQQPPAAASLPRCVSHRKFTIYVGGHGRVRVVVAGKARWVHLNKRGRVGVDLRGLPRGQYAVVVRRGHRRVKRLYSVCGAGNLTAYNTPAAGA